MARQGPTTRDEAGVVLNFRDLYDKPVHIDDLKALLATFATDDWICQLARLTCLLGGNRSRAPEWANSFLQYFTPPQEIDRVNRWFAEHHENGTTAVVPSERHVEILLELAVLYAPSTAQRRMAFPGDERTVFDALLMVATLETDIPKANTSDSKEFVAAISTVWLRAICPDPLEMCESGYYTFEILGGEKRSPPAKEWALLFKAATGQELDDYFAGGFGYLVVLLHQTPQDLAEVWQSVLDPALLSSFPKFKQASEAYASLRTASIDTLRQEITKHEPGEDLGSFNLIALRRFPLLEYKGGIYPLSFAGLANSLMDGVYHAVVTAALRSGQTKKVQHRLQHVGGVFGRLYEQQANDLLGSKYDDRLIRCPRRKDTGNEAADALLLCDKGLIVFQTKSRHVLAKQKYVLRTPRTLNEYFERIGLVEAVEQVCRTIEACRAAQVEGLPEHWSQEDTPIQPIVITQERVPEFSLIRDAISTVTAIPKSYKSIRPVILMSSKDVENVVSLPPSDDLWGVLTDYLNSGAKESFFNFLGAKRRADMTLLGERRKNMLSRLKDYLGLQDNESAASGAE